MASRQAALCVYSQNMYLEMQEIWIPEFFVVLFLFLALIRRRVKSLSSQPGIVWLPLSAFFIALALFPAYGFRPEAVPLLLFAVLVTVFHIPAMRASAGDIENAEVSEAASLFTVLGLVFLGAVLVPLVLFSPRTVPSPSGEGIYGFSLDNGNGYSVDVKVYAGESGPGAKARPLLVISPPVFGSSALDELCREYRARGFVVFSYTRGGFISPVDWWKILRVFRAGTRSVAANAWGRAFEEARRAEILFILDKISGNPLIGDGVSLFDVASGSYMFLAGYDASASALALLAGVPGFGRDHPAIKGIIAAEAAIYSLYRSAEPHIEELPPDAPWFRSVKAGLGRWLLPGKPRKISSLAEIPISGIPILFMVSDRAFENPEKYQAVFSYVRSAGQPSAVVAAAGAGPFDYAAFPSAYPLISFLSKGRKKGVLYGPGASAETARIAANFAASVLEAEGGPALAVIPEREPLMGAYQIEISSWILPPLGL